MKILRLSLLPGLCMFFMLTAVQAQKSTDVTEEIQARNDNFMKTIQSGDLNAIAALYTEDAKVFPPNSDIVQGREAIKGMWGAMASQGMPNLIVSTTVAEAFGNTAIEEGAYKIKIPDGQVVDKGKYIVIWKKVDGKWLLHQDIFNTSMPGSQ